MGDTFRYSIRNREIVKELISMGFVEWHRAPDFTAVEAPADLSARKARKLISRMIVWHKADQEYEQARLKLEGAVNNLNRFNETR